MWALIIFINGPRLWFNIVKHENRLPKFSICTSVSKTHHHSHSIHMFAVECLCTIILGLSHVPQCVIYIFVILYDSLLTISSNSKMIATSHWYFENKPQSPQWYRNFRSIPHLIRWMRSSWFALFQEMEVVPVVLAIIQLVLTRMLMWLWFLFVINQSVWISSSINTYLNVNKMAMVCLS